MDNFLEHLDVPYVPNLFTYLFLNLKSNEYLPNFSLFY